MSMRLILQEKIFKTKEIEVIENKRLTTVRTSTSNVAISIVTMAIYPESGAAFIIFCSGCVPLYNPAVIKMK